MATTTEEKPTHATMEKAREVIEREKRAARDISARVDAYAAPIFVGLTLGSIIYSLILYFRKSKESAIFVGLWAPTFLALGLFHRLVGVVRKG